PAELRTEILHLMADPSVGLNRFTHLHYAIGNAFAEASALAIQQAKRKKLPRPHLIGSHGQTVFHAPEGKRTLQISEAALIAAHTGITTVAVFRTADTAQGGEGALLLPYYHRRLFAKIAKKGVAVHNLGGISNCPYIGPRATLFALDTGP